jgi:hypothetical protein
MTARDGGELFRLSQASPSSWPSIRIQSRRGAVDRPHVSITEVHMGAKRARRPLRKGVADLHRRAEVSQRSNERYLDALAAADDTTPLHRLLDAVSKPATLKQPLAAAA